MTLEEYKSKKNKKNNKSNKKYLSNLLTRTLITIILIFGVLIMVNFDKDFKEKIDKYLFQTNYNFSSINKLYNNYFADIFNSSKDTALVFDEKEEKKQEEYTKYKDGVVKEIGKNEEVKLLNGGIVVFVGEKEGYGNTIIVQQSNGTDAWYGNMEKVNVKVYDYIEKDKVIGTASEKLYLVFQKDGEYIDYKEAI